MAFACHFDSASLAHLCSIPWSVQPVVGWCIVADTQGGANIILQPKLQLSNRSGIAIAWYCGIGFCIGKKGSLSFAVDHSVFDLPLCYWVCLAVAFYTNFARGLYSSS